jgi:hypothetical protein
MVKKLDTKSIIIIILTMLLLIFALFRPNKKINQYKDEVKALHQKNQKLLYTNDSLKSVNKEIDIELEKMYDVIKAHETLITEYNDKINELKKQKNETFNKVNILSGDSVAIEFTNYIKKRTGKNICK